MMHFTQSPRISNYAFMTYEHQAKQKKRPKCASLSAINQVLILLEQHQDFFLVSLLQEKRHKKVDIINVNFIYNIRITTYS